MKHRFTGDDRPPPAWKRYAELLWLGARFLNGIGHDGPRGPWMLSFAIPVVALVFLFRESFSRAASR